MLTDWSSVYAWAAAHRESDRLLGRGPVYVVAAPARGPDAREQWAVRHYRRGGAVARFAGDRYWGVGPTRPARELAVSVQARERGVRTPAVVAGAVYRPSGLGRAAGLYRADLVTERVPCARSLKQELVGGADGRGRAPDAEATRALFRAGRLVRALGESGLLHRDLNAGNILLDAEGEAWVVDLDRCRSGSARRSSDHSRMRSRLERSLRKLGNEHRRPLSRTEWEALRSGFHER